MNWLFGEPITVEDRIKAINTDMDAAIKEIKKEKMRLEGEKRKTLQELRTKAANSNRTSSKDLKTLAIRCRQTERQISKLDATVHKLSNFKIMANQLKTTQVLSNSFTKLTLAMRQMNSSMNAYQLYSLVQEYEKQNMVLEEKQKMADEMLENAFEDSEDEEEMADEILQEVLDEFNIKLVGEMPDTTKNVKPVKEEPIKETEEGKGKRMAAAESGSSNTNEEDSLLTRINNLK